MHALVISDSDTLEQEVTIVNTRMVNFNGQINPDESAKGIIQQIDKLSIKNTGSFWHSNGEPLPW